MCLAQWVRLRRELPQFPISKSTFRKSTTKSLFQNQCLLILLPPFFQRVSQPPGQDQQNGKRSVDCHPSPSE